MKLFVQDTSLDLSRPHIMGILNVTPDFLSDGSTYSSLLDAMKHANLIINAGAMATDVGGEPIYPEATKVSAEEKLQRTIPVVEMITQRFEARILVDASKPEVVRESAKAGVHITSGVHSFSELGVLEAVAETGLSACLTYMQGNSKTMQEASKYDDVFVEVNHYPTE